MAEGGVPWIAVIPVALVVVAGAFALIYWWLGSGKDDGQQ